MCQQDKWISLLWKCLLMESIRESKKVQIKNPYNRSKAWKPLCMYYGVALTLGQRCFPFPLSLHYKLVCSLRYAKESFQDGFLISLLAGCAFSKNRVEVHWHFYSHQVGRKGAKFIWSYLDGSNNNAGKSITLCCAPEQTLVEVKAFSRTFSWSRGLN